MGLCNALHDLHYTGYLTLYQIKYLICAIQNCIEIEQKKEMYNIHNFKFIFNTILNLTIIRILIYISLLIISCIIEYVTNKITLNLEYWWNWIWDDVCCKKKFFLKFWIK